MAESLAAIAMISLFAVILGNLSFYETDTSHVFHSDYLLAQSIAMAKAEPSQVECRSDEPLPEIRFSDAGNVSMARTLVIGRGSRTVVIELGFGRLVWR